MSRLDDAPEYIFHSEISDEDTTVIIRVVHEESGEDFAIKVPKTDCDQTAFEAEILQGLNHDAIIELIDVFPTEEGPALVLPFAAGGDVYRLIEKCDLLKESDARTVMFRLLTALAYCHQKRVWHRDVKLENLFLITESFDSVVLGDFGYAINISETPFDWRFLGSPQYAAPEIWQRECYSEKVDMWSAGVTLFAMVAGRFPYDLPAGREVLCITGWMKSLHDAHGLPTVSPQCNDLLLKMLDMDPVTRISAEDALAHEWFAPLIMAMTQCGQPTDAAGLTF
jgi:serine/threonine protein kinase